MPINSLQPRLAQMGVIRLGRQLISKNNKPYPAKLETFRITSPLKSVVEDVARLFGGEVKAWQNTTGPEFEVITRASEMAVWVPPQSIDPNYEHWGNGYRDRLCDGDNEQLSCGPCLCKKQFGEQFYQTAPQGKACKPTTRLSLMIADLRGLGVFKLESKGWNAASELPMLAASIAKAPEPIPARLVLQARQKKSYDPNAADGEQIKSKSFLVPVLHFDWLTPSQSYGGEIESAARAAIGAAPAASDRPAIEAKATTVGNAAPAKSSAEWIADIKSTKTAVDLDALQGCMRTAGVGDKGVVDAWIVRAGELTPKREASKPTDKPEPPATEVIDAVIVDDKTPAMSGAQAWQAALAFAGEKGWNRSQLADRFMAQYNLDYRADGTTDEMLVEFLGLLKSGEVS